LLQADIIDRATFEAKLSLGLKLLDEDRAAVALAPLAEAADLDPGSAEARYLLACAHHDLEQHVEAEAALRAALELEPNHLRAAHRLGVVLSEAEKWPEALAWLRKAAEREPGRGIVQRDLAVALLTMGEIKEARAAYVRATELGWWRHSTLYNAVRLTPMSDSEPGAAALWKALAEFQTRDDLSDEDRVQIKFALGKAHADRGEVGEACEAWAQGARLRRASMNYSVEPTLARWREIARIFDQPLLQRLAGAGSASPTPVFICSLPRAGSTLVEQILSAHPQVLAGGETGALPRVIRSVQTPRGERWPRWASAMNGTDCDRLAEAYLTQIPSPGPGQTRVTDKRPENVETLGLLHLCFPNAALIYVKRDLHDVAFSCWTTLFAEGQPYTYDLEEMAAYFKGIEALVAHWREVLPPGRLLEVPYEELVVEPEAWSRRIVAHCGLDWDARCLEPHKASRPVRTASDAQVRQPINDRSIGRWKPYAEALKPFTDRLGRG
jgi:tetratricopeptide (TPR) repeat protein